ncbi:MAG: membrane protein insertase YidC, partial [Gemmatimonadota bacterium]
MGTEKRLVLAVVLMMSVVFIVNILFPPAPPPEPAEEVETVAAPAEEVPTPGAEALEAPAQELAAEEELALPVWTGPAEPETEDTVWVRSPLYRLGFSQRGARLVSAEMLEFESLAADTKGEPVQLVPPLAENFFTHQWLVGDDTLDLRAASFEAQPAELNLGTSGAPQVLTFIYQHPRVPFRLELRYTFHPGSYVIELEGQLLGVQPMGWWTLGLGPGLLSNEWDPEGDYKANLAFAAKGMNGVKSEKIAGLQPDQRASLDGPFDWVAVRTKYFVTAVVLPLDAASDRR